MEGWLNDNVEGAILEDGRIRVSQHWIDRCWSIAAYLGEFTIRLHPSLRWGLWIRDKRDIDYHQPVIVGFMNVEQPAAYYYGPAFFAVTSATMTIAGNRRDGRLARALTAHHAFV